LEINTAGSAGAAGFQPVSIKYLFNKWLPLSGCSCLYKQNKSLRIAMKESLTFRLMSRDAMKYTKQATVADPAESVHRHTLKPRFITVGRGPMALRLPRVELTGRERELERWAKSLPAGTKRRAAMRVLRAVNQLHALEAEYGQISGTAGL
jgi:hypothetical protein